MRPVFPMRLWVRAKALPAVAWLSLACAIGNAATVDIAEPTSTSIVDYSDLNTKIADGEFVERCGQEFCRVVAGSDRRSEVIRFWGVNLGFEAAFPNSSDSKIIASRLRRLGVNIVRLHALDIPTSQPDSARSSILREGPYPSFNDESLGALKNFLEDLRREGIYVSLSVHVAHRLRPSDVGLTATANSIPPHSKPLQIILDRYIERQQVFIRDLIDRLGLKNSPQLAMIDISNESSMLDSWQKGNLDSSLKGSFREIFKQKFRDYITKAKLEVNCNEIDLKDLNHPPAICENAFVDFLIYLDRSYFDRVSAAIKAGNPRVLITGTQVEFEGYGGLLSDSSRDYSDSHIYVDHFHFSNGAWGWSAWNQTNSTLNEALNRLAASARLRQARTPFVVSEYNRPWPSESNASFIGLTMLVAARQNWQGLIYYDYAHRRNWDARAADAFSLNGNPSATAIFGHAAFAFRRGLISSAPSQATTALSPDYIRSMVKGKMPAGSIIRLSEMFDKRGANLLETRFDVQVGSNTTERADETVQQSVASPDGSADIQGGIALYKGTHAYLLVGSLGGGEASKSKGIRIKNILNEPQTFAILITGAKGRALDSEATWLLTAISSTIRRDCVTGTETKTTSVTKDTHTITSPNNQRYSKSIEFAGPCDIDTARKPVLELEIPARKGDYSVSPIRTDQGMHSDPRGFTKWRSDLGVLRFQINAKSDGSSSLLFAVRRLSADH